MGKYLFKSKNIFINLTYKCCAKCEKCITRHHINVNRDMDMETMNMVLSKLKKSDYRGLVSIGSGEPLLYKNLSVFIKEILDINDKIRLRILTNGVLFKEEIQRLYYDPRILWGITLDGFCNEDLENLQHGVDIEVVKENILSFISKYKGKGLYLNYTLNEKNKDNLINYLKFCKVNNIEEVYVTELKVFDKYYDKLIPYKLDLSKENTKKVLKEAEEYVALNELNVGFGKSCFKPKCWERRRVSPIIDVDGSVTFCAGREDVDVGNIRDYDIEMKWLRVLKSLVESHNGEKWCNYCGDRCDEEGIYRFPKKKYTLQQ